MENFDKMSFPRSLEKMGVGPGSHYDLEEVGCYG